MEETEPTFLPEAIIHRIQNYLGKKEAARTCVLSKSWYTAWSTHPVINLDESDFRAAQEFSNFSRRTLLRYKRLHLCIENFELFMRVGNVGDDSSSLASELIIDALQLKVNYLGLEIISLPRNTYVLPVQVFATISLKKLAVRQCQVSGLTDGGVNCSNLASLSLFRVSIEDDMIRRILLGCPFIENLRLIQCKGLRNINLSEMHKLRKVSVRDRKDDLKIEFEERRVGSVLYGQVNVPKFRYLSSLILKDLNIDNTFFHEFSHKFPCLGYLTLADCHGYRDVRISSHSLEHINLTCQYRKLKKACFDVPGIRKFKFIGINFPSLSVTTASREWESDIKLSCLHDVLKVSWFRKLRNFLAQLSFSKISLSLEFDNEECDAFVGDVQGFPIPVVENLMLKVATSVCYSLLNGLFWSCRPKFITQCDGNDTQLREMNRRLLWLLRKRLRQKDNQNCINDLEEAIPEFFEETLLKWQPFPPEAFFIASKIPERRKQIRFRLTWDHFSVPDPTMVR
ncbi:hypothetical protein ACJIZ3_014043 [Penstemon smallii]|uniref:F-box/LRR-repeat protein 15/At3g58940/PEG3-like LRR domain-containing protein n=1 Tax=Penstemon smallii TaxID=265156 RepID=A0ABD3RUD2_9LAMI